MNPLTIEQRSLIASLYQCSKALEQDAGNMADKVMRHYQDRIADDLQELIQITVAGQFSSTMARQLALPEHQADAAE